MHRLAFHVGRIRARAKALVGAPGPGAIVGGGAGDFAERRWGCWGGEEVDPGSNLVKLGLPGKVTECRKKASTFFRAKILVAEVEYSVAS